ncbi:MAG: transketolase [Planctomycetota bacterium]
MPTEPDIVKLKQTAARLRANIVRMIAAAGSGHNGGALSAIDMITYLYFHQMRIDPQRPDWPDRDRFVLSKGHCCPALYAALAARGYFGEELLWTLRDVGSLLQGHPDMTKTSGVDMTTGSLGQGISAAVGIALGGKLDRKDYRVYCMVGDGELQEGQVWEAAMSAAHYRLTNLTVLVDDNGMETDGPTHTIMNVQPIAAKWQAFGWHTCEIDGHDFRQIHAAVRQCLTADQPSAIVARTVEGKGVSFMEGDNEWHSGPTRPEQTQQALAELELQLAQATPE